MTFCFRLVAGMLRDEIRAEVLEFTKRSSRLPEAAEEDETARRREAG
jgi:hypothetical protein